MDLKPRNAVFNVKEIFKKIDAPLTLTDLKEELPKLKSSDISMALCYLLKNNFLSRELIKNPIEKHRKSVYQYTLIKGNTNGN